MSHDPDAKYLIGNDKEQAVEEAPAPPRPMKVEIRKGVDKQGNATLSALTTVSEVAEEHVYLVYRGITHEMVIECDLLGDQAIHKSDGKLPPVIHLECPRCTQPDEENRPKEASRRSILSLTHGNKHYEIQDLEEKDWGVVTMPDGRPVMGSDKKPAIVKRLLTVKETFKCSYCGARFKITDNIMQDA